MVCPFVPRVVARIVGCHEPLTCSLLVGLHLRLGVGSHLLVYLDVARDAQQLAVGRVEGEASHFLFGASLLYWSDVVHVNAWCDVPFGSA